MDPITVGYLSLAAIAVAIYAGIHVAIALAGVSLFGVWAITGKLKLATSFVALAATDSIAEYTFGVVPLFVLMGLAVSESGLGRDTFAIIARGLQRWRAGLSVATVLSNAVFAAITGVSIASAAVFSKVAVPEMVRAGTSRSIAVGVVAGSSVLGMLIPPSLLLILFAILTDSSVGDLFIGGVGPGLLLATAYIVYLSVLGFMRPDLFNMPSEFESSDRVPTRAILPIIGLAATVLAGIYLGFFTPTEAGAVGAVLALLIGLAMRRIGARESWRIAVQTGHITAAVSFLIIGASIYSRMLAFSGLPASITQAAVDSGIGPTAFLLLFVCILVVLGTVLDSSSIMLVTVPLAFPITQEMGIDLVHFGLITVLAVEVGLLTPPLGLSVFVVHATLRDSGLTLGEVFRGAAPFALIMAATLVALIFYPQIATGLLGR
ncbi:TRAP transporter large permease [Pseudosulfitobacter sp. DSM 107133]|uniref:TRAP transporter large permease n=1 Tax=Pseudosulfitobacter sp. DSM 107133 TaxID=2883100 RepID=UPI000DF3E404|nr:TRAP transporter large permease [Pseudosulfitobacter sp. DSM 107133]UOA29133.1 C4-dicarboxylate TRAP transporter large permease protein DctM [Pseudosulfitobacter sp. DSM 107133]